MKHSIYAVVAVATLLCSLTALAQPDTVWTREYDYSNWGYHESLRPYEMFELDDGDFAIVLADTIGHLVLMKLAENGDSLWTRTYENPGNRGFSLKSTLLANGDIAVFTPIRQFGNPIQYFLRVFVFGQDGELHFTREIPDDGSWFDCAATPDGGIVLSSRASNHSYVAKLDGALETVWNTEIDTLGFGYVRVSVDEAGWIFFNDWGSAGLMSPEGELLWVRVFDESNNDSVDTFIEHCAADENGFWIVGDVSREWPQYYDCFIVKYEHDGDSAWSRTFRFGPNDYGFTSVSIDLTAESDLVVSGLAWREGGPRHVVFRVSSDGDLQWAATEYYGFPEGVAVLLAVLDDGGFLMIGEVERNEFQFVHTEPDLVSAIGNLVAVPSSITLHPNYPNPFNPATEISFELPQAMHTTLKVFDVLGREVATLTDGVMSAGAHYVTFDANDLSSGVYFYRLEAGSFVETRKMVLMK